MTDELDLENRELCTDGACVGVMGPDGRCTECGRTQGQAAAGEEAEALADFAEPETSSEEVFDADRELCADGACIGIIGPDGRCKECGAPRQKPAGA